ncbi:MAG: glucosyltransferase domain-containing protein [Clostridiales bacterium]|nr:glucosyltransferase domain-containing protein [Clostridiales bacterium]
MNMPILISLRDNFKRIKFTFLTTFSIGMLAHGYMFANSFTNRDNIKSFMNAGETISSGRWFLGILKNINEILFGSSVSVPWMIGIIGCIWLSLSACILVELFDVSPPRFKYL